MLDLLVKGDLVLNEGVSADGRGGRPGWEGGGVVCLAERGPGGRGDPGRLRLPDLSGGMVDAHVHCHSNTAENFELATQAAAAGGVTTIVEMPYDQGAPVNRPEVFRKKVGVIPARSAGWTWPCWPHSGSGPRPRRLGPCARRGPAASR